MQNRQGEFPTKSPFLWLIATPLAAVGSFTYIASPLIGSGVHLDPEPGAGMLIAGAGLAIAFGGYSIIHSERKASILATVINFALIWGSLALVGGITRWGFEMVYKVQDSEESHSRPGELLFIVSYGILSVAALAAFNYWIRKQKSPATKPSGTR